MAALRRIYDSKYTSKKLTASQYIAEIMTERLAKKDGKILNEYFWNEEEWKIFYFMQVRLANGLLRSYTPEVIVQALGNFPWIYSLRHPKVQETIDQIYTVRNKDAFDTSESEDLPKSKREDSKKEKNIFERLN